MDNFPTLVNCSDKSIVTINNSTFNIGRSLSCDHIIESLGVSRLHCTIKKTNNRWLLFDKSTNGTEVNSRLYRNNQTVELKAGDRINFNHAHIEFIFYEPPSEAALAEHSDTEPIDAEELKSLLGAAEKFDEDFTLEPPKPEPPPPPANLDIMENELTCSICSELFIKAVTLTCSHTYCKYCIDQWRRNKSTCPICRKAISGSSPTLVLDNFISKILESQGEELRRAREEMVKQRESVECSVATTSGGPGRSCDVIEIFSEDDYFDDDDDDDDDDYDLSDYDYDEDYNGMPGNFYGGYGRCFICSQRGHWANGCPLKR